MRINDILSELERQVGPLERQSEKAKTYLKKKEELKSYDVNMFLLEIGQIDTQLKETEENCQIAGAQLKDTAEKHETIKGQYEKIEAAMEAAAEDIEAVRQQLNQAVITKSRLEGDVNVLTEQVKAAKLSDAHFKSRVAEIEADKSEKARQKEAYETEEASLAKQLLHITACRKGAEGELKALQAARRNMDESIKQRQEKLLALLNQKAQLQAKQQKFDTLT